MSHIDAPLRSRRHSDPSPANSNKVRRRQPAPRSANDTHDYAPDALLFPVADHDDSVAASSPARRAFAARAPLKTLLLPAELELRRVAARPDSVLLRSARPAGPRHYATDSSFRLHALVARQSSSSGARTTYAAALDDALEDVDASTDCGAVAAAYRGSASTPQVVALCTRRRRAVIRATQAEASASSSRAAASTSRAVASASSRSSRAAAASSSSRAAAAAAASSSSSSSASSSRSAAAAATRTRTRLIQRTTRPANTPRIAAPITTPLNPSQASASRFSELESFVSSQFDDAASVITSRAAAASSSREALQSSVDSLFSSALVVVSSRRASATASSTAQVSASSSATTPTSTSTSLPPSSSSSTSADPSSTSSGAEPSATAAPASGNSNRIAKIVGPSVAIPLGLLLLGLLAFCLLRRRRRRRNAAGPLGGRSTPGGLGPISNPQPMQAAPQQYGAMARFAPGAGSGSGMGGVGVGAGVGAAAAAGAGGAAAVGAARGNNDSQESVGTTPSAIGVAFSEPRTKWGRRSLVDVLAGGVRSANSGSNSPSGSGAGTGFGTPERQFRGVSGTSSFGGRQPSITSLASGSIPSEYRGVGGYNSFGYQPGQMRPVMTPLGGHYDPFAPSPSIVPVPASAQRHPYPVPSEEGSISGYGSGSGSHSGSGSGDDLARQYGGAAPAGERATFGDGAAAQPGLPYLAPLRPDMGRSRTTGTTTTGEEGYYTADPGASSRDELESETLEEVVLRDFGVEDYSPEERSVNFGSGSSGSGGSGSAGRPSFVGSVRRSFEEPGVTPRVGSRTSTPRLGSGHGSLGTRRNDGTGSWWN